MKVLIAASTTTERRHLIATLDRCWAIWGAFEVATGPGGKLEEWVSTWAERRGAAWTPLRLCLWPEERPDAAIIFDAAHSPRTRILARQVKRLWGVPVHEYGAKEKSDG
jgi:hypothetical protein